MAGGGLCSSLAPLLLTVATALLGVAGENECHTGWEGWLKEVWEGGVEEVGQGREGGLIGQVDQVGEYKMGVVPARGKRGAEGEITGLFAVSEKRAQFLTQSFPIHCTNSCTVDASGVHTSGSCGDPKRVTIPEEVLFAAEAEKFVGEVDHWKPIL